MELKAIGHRMNDKEMRMKIVMKAGMNGKEITMMNMDISKEKERKEKEKERKVMDHKIKEKDKVKQIM